MKGKCSFLFFILLGSVYSDSSGCFGIIEGKAAYFYPFSSSVREIYSDSGSYGLEASCRIYRDLYLWTSGNYLFKKGSSLGESHSTRLLLVPLGLGLEYFFPIRWAAFYVGIGGLGTYVHIRDDSPYVIRTSCCWQPGGLLKGGIILRGNRIFLDLFAESSFLKVNFHNTDEGRVIRRSANLSGLSAGAGVGFCF